jgi:hypothetical protein
MSTHLRALLAASLLSACAPPATGADPRAPSPSALSPLAEAEGFRLREVPPDVAARSAALLAVTCPAGRHVVERIERGRHPALDRRCEDARGQLEGPTVAFTGDGATTLRRGGEHLGRRDGPQVIIDHGFITGVTFAAGRPRGRYVRRQRTTGIAVIEGEFDDAGNPDGTWTFREPDTGKVLGRSALANGTGTLEVWDAGAAAVYPDVQVSRQTCVAGLWDGPQLERLPAHAGSWDDARDHLVEATYRGGVAEGAFTRRRVSGLVVAAGRYAQGAAVGSWAMVADEVCRRWDTGGDQVWCPQVARDVAYTCVVAGGQCAAEGPPPPGGDEWRHPPATMTAVRRCDVPRLLE